LINIIESFERSGYFDSTENCAYEIGRNENIMDLFITRACSEMKVFPKNDVISKIDLSRDAAINGILLIEHGKKIRILEVKWCKNHIKKFKKTMTNLDELTNLVENGIPSKYFREFEMEVRKYFGSFGQF